MFFEAEMNGTNYEVQVNELRHLWKINLREKQGPWVHFEVKKSDYRSLDDTISFLFRNSSYLVDVVATGNQVAVYTRGSYRIIKIFNEETLLHESLKGGDSLAGGDQLAAGMPGKIVKVFVENGDIVDADAPLLIMEAMKMENELRATHRVRIKKVAVAQGESVESGAVLVEFEEVEEKA
jgi:biotin carboxyl carrier protein